MAHDKPKRSKAQIESESVSGLYHKGGLPSRVRAAGVGSGWGPHKVYRHTAVATRTLDLPNGRRVRKGYRITFADKSMRDNWLRTQGFRGRL